MAEDAGVADDLAAVFRQVSGRCTATLIRILGDVARVLAAQLQPEPGEGAGRRLFDPRPAGDEEATDEHDQRDPGEYLDRGRTMMGAKGSQGVKKAAHQQGGADGRQRQ